MAAQRYQHGDLTLRKRKTKPPVWQFRYINNGKRKSIQIGTIDKYPTKSDAERAVEHIRMEINKNNPQQAFHSVSVTGLFNRFMEEYAPIHCRPETQRVYRCNFANYVEPRWGTAFVEDVKPMAVMEWLSSLQKSRQVKSHLRSLMHVMFNAAILWEITDRNPVTPVKQSRKRLKNPIILSPAQTRAFVEELKEPYKLMVLLDLSTGLRASELLALRWQYIDFENLRVWVKAGVVGSFISQTKNDSSEGFVPLDTSLAEILLVHRENSFYQEDSDFVFANADGKPPWRDSILSGKLKPAAAKAGIDNLGWHTFRRTFASSLHSLGSTLAVQKELMRHADIQTTMNIYTQSGETEKREAVSKVVNYLWKD